MSERMTDEELASEAKQPGNCEVSPCSWMSDVGKVTVRSRGVSAASVSFSLPPQPVGFLTLVKGYEIAGYKKPNWFHRLMLRLAFGWTWRDLPKR